MGARKPFVGGNWKMNLHAAEAAALAKALAGGVADDKVEVAVFPAFTYLSEVGKLLAGSKVKLGAQDFYPAANGAYTGEVSLSMLKDVGVQVVLIGHSERRHVMGESDQLIQDKVRAAVDAGFQVIYCIGEKLPQREKGLTDAINIAQTCHGLAGLNAGQLAKVTLAYEPVWAIGTGKTATSADAQAAHLAIRATLAKMFVGDAAAGMRIQYGGSMNAANAAELLAQPDIDGGLIGGASLKPDDFLKIIAAAKARA